MAGVINVFCGKHSGLDINSCQFLGAVGQRQESGVVWEWSGEESDTFLISVVANLVAGAVFTLNPHRTVFLVSAT
jgi:hypothetical protein